MFAEVLLERMSGIADLLPGQVAQLQSHCDLLVRWNQRMSLTSITDPKEIIERHFCESLFLAARLPPGQHSVLDIGSGAGFPGLPVAVLRPDCSVTLLESRQRKAAFLREASRKLPNIRVMAIRLEAVTELFEWGLSRAVSYDALGAHLERIVGNAALLTGTEEPPQGWNFQWEQGIAAPWGSRRFLRIGHRK